MDFNIIKEVNSVLKSRGFNKCSQYDQMNFVLIRIKTLVSKFLSTYEVFVNDDEKLSYMVKELNNKLNYDVKQKFNWELSHALINALIAIEGHYVELIETDDKHFRINPLYSYDINMTLQSIKTYSEMDLGNLSISLLKTIEASLNDSKGLKLQK